MPARRQHHWEHDPASGQLPPLQQTLPPQLIMPMHVTAQAPAPGALQVTSSMQPAPEQSMAQLPASQVTFCIQDMVEHTMRQLPALQVTSPMHDMPEHRTVHAAPPVQVTLPLQAFEVAQSTVQFSVGGQFTVQSLLPPASAAAEHPRVQVPPSQLPPASAQTAVELAGCAVSGSPVSAG
jgi:hypothetical protein